MLNVKWSLPEFIFQIWKIIFPLNIVSWKFPSIFCRKLVLIISIKNKNTVVQFHKLRSFKMRWSIWAIWITLKTCKRHCNEKNWGDLLEIKLQQAQGSMFFWEEMYAMTSCVSVVTSSIRSWYGLIWEV